MSLEQQARRAAMDLLARREHSFFELQQKLRLRNHQAEVIDKALLRLQQQGLQSDQRFAEMYLRSCVNRGLGPVRIKQELQQRQVATYIIEQVFQQGDFPWLQLCSEACAKRFGEEIATEAKQRAKQARFLQYRGFTFEQINTILRG